MSRRTQASRRFFLASTSALTQRKNPIKPEVVFPDRSSLTFPRRSITNKADLRIIQEAFPDIADRHLKEAHKTLKPIHRRLDYLHCLVERNFTISFNAVVASEFLAAGLFPNYLALFLPPIGRLTDDKVRFARGEPKKSLKEWAFAHDKGEEFIDGLKIYVPLFSREWTEEHRRNFLKFMDCCDEPTIRTIMSSLGKTERPLMLSSILADRKPLSPLFVRMSAKTVFTILEYTIKDIPGYEGDYDWLVKPVGDKPLFKMLMHKRDGLELVINGLKKRKQPLDIQHFYDILFSAAEAGLITEIFDINLTAPIDPKRVERVGHNYRSSDNPAAKFFATADTDAWLPHLDKVRAILTPFQPITPVRTAFSGALLRANLKKSALGS